MAQDDIDTKINVHEDGHMSSDSGSVSTKKARQPDRGTRRIRIYAHKTVQKFKYKDGNFRFYCTHMKSLFDRERVTHVFKITIEGEAMCVIEKPTFDRNLRMKILKMKSKEIGEAQLKPLGGPKTSAGRTHLHNIKQCNGAILDTISPATGSEAKVSADFHPIKNWLLLLKRFSPDDSHVKYQLIQRYTEIPKKGYPFSKAAAEISRVAEKLQEVGEERSLISKTDLLLQCLHGPHYDALKMVA
eukprot:1336763-Amorphochlora_amoeboformis.AAC.1